MKLRASFPLSTKIARDDLAKAATSGFALAAVDILTGADHAEHLAAVMVWGVNEDEAKQRQAEIVRRVNAHDALVAFVKSEPCQFVPRGCFDPEWKQSTGMVCDRCAALKAVESEVA